MRACVRVAAALLPVTQVADIDRKLSAASTSTVPAHPPWCAEEPEEPEEPEDLNVITGRTGGGDSRDRLLL